MPETATLIKIQNTKRLGAKVHLEGHTYDEAYQAALRIAQETGRVYVHAYEDADIIAGQGTLALEVLEQLPDVDTIIGSIGGGGLMAGVAVVMKEKKPSVKVIGCQAKGSPSMTESLKKGHAIKLSEIQTFADGIAVSQASEKMLKLLAPRLDGAYEADEEAIAAAVLSLLEKAKVVAEGSGAVPLAILDQIKNQIAGKKVVLIVSGGNIDVNLLGRIIDRGLIKAGRRIRINVWISDHPGSLSKLTQLIAKEGANIVQTIHDRSDAMTLIDQTEVDLTLETKGPEHSTRVIDALKKIVIRLELKH